MATTKHHIRYSSGNLNPLITAGTVPQSKIDSMGVNILTPYFKFAQNVSFPSTTINFSNPKGAPTVNVAGNHSILARTIGIFTLYIH